MDFFCELLNELFEPKTLSEFIITSLSGFLGAGVGVYWGQNQARKVKEKQDQLLREVLLKNCLAITNTNKTLLENDGINFNDNSVYDIGEIRGRMVRLIHGLTTESYFALMDTGLQQILDKKFQDSILYVRALLIQLKAKISGCHAMILDYEDNKRHIGQQEWRSFIDDMKKTVENLQSLRTTIKNYLLEKGWKESEIE